MTKKAKDFRALTIDELKTKVVDLKTNYSKELVKSKIGSQNEKSVNLRNIRKDVARVLTIISEKEKIAKEKAKEPKKVSKKKEEK